MKNLLELRGVSAGYGNGRGNDGPRGIQKKAAIGNVDLLVEEGELVVLAGPNGSGKTTLLKTAGGLLAPMEGRVAVNGKDVSTLKRRERAALTAFLFQVRDSPWPFTVRETIAQGRFFMKGWLGSETREDREVVAAALDKADLGVLADRPITELSGGELQRVYIARCIAQGAAFLLFDEPENNLDPKYAYMIMTLVKDLVREGRGAIVSLHDLRLANAFADRIVLLSRPSKNEPASIFAAGIPGEILTTESVGRVFDLSPNLVKSMIL